MSDYLTPTERATFSGDAEMVFETMSKGRTVTIVREAIKTLVTQNSTENLFGFGNDQKDAVYSYTPVSGVFPAIIKYPMDHPSPLNPEMGARIYAGPMTMKVKTDCRDYINGGKVEYIITDGKHFMIDGEERRQMFLSSEYFFFTLKALK
jgi:hypothetical protein